jgi:cyclopropane fatty-acyl-phospholipid synthase-like methyltransferase
LNEQRLGCVLAGLKSAGATRVLDLGCGEGRLLQAMLKERQFAEIVGLDVSHRALEIARDRLHYDRLPPVQKARLRLLHGSLIYRDQRLAGFDAAAVVEVSASKRSSCIARCAAWSAKDSATFMCSNRWRTSRPPSLSASRSGTI